MAKLKDIAEQAGVSISTVSRVLNHDKNFSVSFANRHKILKIAQQLQYPPKEAPRATAALPAIGAIGLVLLYSETDELEDPYYLAIRTNFKAEAVRLGVKVAEYFHPDPVRDIQLGEHPVVVVIGSGGHWSGRLRDTILTTCPSRVFVDFSVDDPDGDFILTDFAALTGAALDHLITRGFNRIGFIGSRDIDRASHTAIQDERETWFVEFLKERGRYNPAHVFLASEASLEAGYQLAKAALSDPAPPEAFFIETDTMAIGAIKALTDAGKTVPGDVSIVSCNDIPEAQYVEPALTTMRIHTELMGVVAARMAVEKALYARRGGLKVLIPNELVERESCGRRGF